MSLEDHNLATMLEDVKTEKITIKDANYIDFCLHEKGLGSKDAEDLREKELQKLLRVYNTRTEPILRSNADRARRRERGEEGIGDDEAVPPYPEVPDTFNPFTDDQQLKIDEFAEAFNHYSRALQYTWTKVTKGEPYRFVVKCNHNNSSGLETWRRLHMTYDQGEKAQHLATLSRIMRPTWNNIQQANNKQQDNSSRTFKTGETRFSTTRTQYRRYRQ
eukprot:1689080-Amphidinium_carterae.1